MIRSRSAIIMLIACLLLVPHSRGSQSSVTGDRLVGAGASSYISSSLGWLACHRLPRRAATLSRFVPWKSRVKSVIEERVHEVADECDLGPAVPPDRHICPARVTVVAPPKLKLPPLRC